MPASAAGPTRGASGALAPPVKRLLVKEVNWLGDLVISLPALAMVRQAFADATLAVLVKHELTGFFDGLGWIDEVIPYRVPYRVAPYRGLGVTRGVADRWRLIRDLRRRNFDLAILFPNSFESALWVTLAGLPRRAGWATDARTWMLTAHAKPTIAAQSGHQRGYWTAMLEATLGLARQATPSTLPFTAAPGHRQAMHRWLVANRRRPTAPLLALAPGAAYGPAKEWPPARFATLIDEADRRWGAECVLIGAPSERARCEHIVASSRAGGVVAAGATGIGELIGLLSLCGGFAGNDSGAMHLAAALELPTVGIFGSTNPDRTGPTGPHARVVYHRIACSPCLARTCRYGHYDCLQQITPAEVVAALAGAGFAQN